ncbi:MAG: hypothetical protein V4465_00375 [Patescibacteria group bacterium]
MLDDEIKKDDLMMDGDLDDGLLSADKLIDEELAPLGKKKALGEDDDDDDVIDVDDEEEGLDIDEELEELES